MSRGPPKEDAPKTDTLLVLFLSAKFLIIDSASFMQWVTGEQGLVFRHIHVSLFVISVMETHRICLTAKPFSVDSHDNEEQDHIPKGLAAWEEACHTDPAP